jgi:transglutaminase-like putative cysteine protease
MQIRVGYELTYTCPQETPMIFLLNIHSSRASDILVPDPVITLPSTPVAGYHDSFGNRCTRIVAPPGELRIFTDALVNDTGLPDIIAPGMPQTPVEALPEETIQFLLGSRYCETDVLSPIAWQLFGKTPMGWERVRAICDFVHNHIQFGYGFARSTKTAWQVYEERAGVCRDFAHLAIAFCRCMNIPARYCTGYLGDIRVPSSDAPMDFSGWFEAFLDGRWYTFDARHNAPRIGRVLIARGRDASDVAISTTFGPNLLQSFKVWTDEVVVRRHLMSQRVTGDADASTASSAAVLSASTLTESTSACDKAWTTASAAASPFASAMGRSTVTDRESRTIRSSYRE